MAFKAEGYPFGTFDKSKNSYTYVPMPLLSHFYVYDRYAAYIIALAKRLLGVPSDYSQSRSSPSLAEIFQAHLYCLRYSRWAHLFVA